MYAMYDESVLKDHLSRLSAHHRIAFAAFCCERLVPLYEAFCLMEKWGNPAPLHKSLSAIWGHLMDVPLPPAQIRTLTRSCEKVVPDSEDFASLFSGSAQCAAFAICYTLECMAEDSVEQAVLPARLAIEALDEYLSIVNTPIIEAHAEIPELAQWIPISPLMQAELTLQQQCLRILQETPALRAETLEALRRMAQNGGIRPIERGIVIC